MGMYEKVSELAAMKNVSIAQVERDLGYGDGSLRKLKTNSPNSERVVELAAYFGVSVDWLCGTTEIRSPADKLLDSDLISLQRAKQNMSGEEWSRAMQILRAGFSDAFRDE